MSEELVHKVTLSSGKEVLLREFKIRHQRLAAQAAAPKSGDNASVLGLGMAEEILKLLVCQIDGKAPERSSLEDLDSVFTYPEYNECLKVVTKLMGGDTPDPKMEVVSFGGQ